MSRTLDHLKSEVAHATSVMQSATTLIGIIAASIRDNLQDPDALTTLADQLEASATALASAVTENTAAANLGGDSTHPSQVDSSTGDGGAAAAGASETATEGDDDTGGGESTDEADDGSSGASGGEDDGA